MDFFTLLKKEHKEVKALFKELLKEEEPDHPKTDLLCHKLLLHMEMEEKYFYPVAQKMKSTAKIGVEAEVEHAEAKKFIRQLLNKELESVEYKVKLEMLHLAIEHHVEEEETEFFPQAEKELSREQIEDITQKMIHLKEKKADTISV
jgi:hemerythrin-like domain-containing protein